MTHVTARWPPCWPSSCHNGTLPPVDFLLLGKYSEYPRDFPTGCSMELTSCQIMRRSTSGVLRSLRSSTTGSTERPLRRCSSLTTDSGDWNVDSTPGRIKPESQDCSPYIDVSNDVDAELQQIPATTSEHQYIMTRVRTGNSPSTSTIPMDVSSCVELAWGLLSSSQHRKNA